MIVLPTGVCYSASPIPRDTLTNDLPNTFKEQNRIKTKHLKNENKKIDYFLSKHWNIYCNKRDARIV
jgi:hypothetical protein